MKKKLKEISEDKVEELIKSKTKLVEDIEKEEESKEILKEIYNNIMDILKKYCDIKEEYYSLIAIWIIGTHFHKEFETYPYLFINAMKGSGKTRLLKLIAFLSKGGEILNSLTEAVLFRTKGTLCIDEFEGITRKGSENLRELLNSAYKKGAVVKRMKKKNTKDGEEQVVEEFEVYRPIAMANIWGMENVLGDRCINVVLEKSNNEKITMLMEIFNQDLITTSTKELFTRDSVVKCSVVTSGKVYRDWNEYITTNYITTQTNNYTKLHKLFNKVKEARIDGRNLELSLPLLMIANEIGEEIFDGLMETIKVIISEKRTEEFTESKDVGLIDFVSQEKDDGFPISVSELARRFKEFLQVNDEWINSRWIGRALRRLNLIKKKKRVARGIEVVLDIEKAKQKIKMFK